MNRSSLIKYKLYHDIQIIKHENQSSSKCAALLELEARLLALDAADNNLRSILGNDLVVMQHLEF